MLGMSSGAQQHLCCAARPCCLVCNIVSAMVPVVGHQAEFPMRLHAATTPHPSPAKHRYALVKIAAAPFGAEVFTEHDLHRLDELPVPEWLKHQVGKP
eukprot:353000-Chlamydomonas_euryale.AAC.25